MRGIGEGEREITFETPLDFELPDLRRASLRTRRLPAEEFTTVYVDTADGRLWAQGVTLQHRRSGTDTDGTWTVGTVDAGVAPVAARRDRSWPGAADDVPADALAGVWGLTRRAPLQPVAVLQTVRRRLVLGDGERMAAELDDDRIAVVGGGRDGVRLRRIELGLGPGSRRLGERVVAAMERAGATRRADPALAEVADLDAASRTGVVLDRRSSTGDVVRAAVSDGLRRLLDGDWRLRMAMPDVDADDVHHARVATRRLRSHLKVLRDVLDPLWVNHVRDDLRWWGAVLGDVRDADVLARHFNDAGAPVALLGQLAGQRAEAVQRLGAALGSNRYLDLLDRLHAAAAAPPLWPGSDDGRAEQRAAGVLTGLAVRRHRAVRRAVRRGGKKPSNVELHRIRIKAKQLRYLAELAVPVVGKPARRTASAAEELQSVLGAHYDAVAAGVWLRTWAQRAEDTTTRVAGFAGGAAPPAMALYEAGRLETAERRRQRTLRRRWPAAWVALRRRDPDRWRA